MKSKEELRQVINLVREFKGSLTLSYIPQSKMQTPEKVYSLYYGGWNKIEIDDFYRNGKDFIEISESNIDEIIDKVYDCLSDNIGNCIMDALTNLELDDTDLKYFDRDPELFKKFQDEVLRLKNNCN